jgi:hypothetical protein
MILTTFTNLTKDIDILLIILLVLKELHCLVKNNRIELSLSSQYKQSIEKHNETVKQNRKILGQLITAVCFLGSQGLAFRGHEESGASVNRGNYIEVLNMLARYDSDLLVFHTPGRNFSKTVPLFRESS